MAKLIVVGFKNNIHRASEMLNTLSSMDDDWVVDLQDAVAVYRTYNGKLRVDQSYETTTGEGATLGGLLGSLIGLMLGAVAAPYTGGTSAAAAGALAAGALGGSAVGAAGGAIEATWWKDNFGISNDFVKEAGAMVQPGDSAIFALGRTAEPDILAEWFRGYGGTVLQSTLTKDQADKVQAALDGKKKLVRE